MVKCKICHSENKKIFNAEILNKYLINYYYCNNCGFLQTEEPFWLEEAYKNPINISDTGYIKRNITLSKMLTILLTVFFNKKGCFLDFAGGYGVFVRLMRDNGFNFYWDDKFTKNLFAIGFDWKSSSLADFDAITTFESFEHFSDPMKEIKKMLDISKSIIFSTELLPTPVPESEKWWYYGLKHGQHISFYRESTFKYIAGYFGINYYNIGSLHLLTDKQNISNIKLNIIKLSMLGLSGVFKLGIKSKTWDDHLLMNYQKEK